MFDDVSMKGKKVLITAGASGLGLEMAKSFLGAGCEVFICDVDEKQLSIVQSEFPTLHTAVSDVSNEASVSDLFQQVNDRFGSLDVLINNAGIAGPTAYIESVSKADWDKTLDINITGQFLCARLAVPMLKKSVGGVMINMSSVAGHLGYAGRIAYSASKWAVIGFTKSLAIELGQFGIRVNAILPGAVEGPRVQAVIAAKAQTLGVSVEELTKTYANQASLGRMVTAKDIANMALFTASSAANSVTGQALVVDGHMQSLV
ncbi:MAG: SDR family oxidoreductase [Burkholderiaceae bacterium]|nr:SDR family oxidoreductase [Burkholderiaceae bacterium]